MQYPTLTEQAYSRQVVDQFGGLDRNLRIATNAFYDMQNITGDEYPVFSTRKHRGVYGAVANAGGIITKDSLAIVSGENIIYNGSTIAMGLTAGVKQLVSMGAYLLVFPDKKYLNTKDFTDKGEMENTRTANDVLVTLCKRDGTPYEVGGNIGSAAPNDPQDGTLWMDTSGDAPALKQYAESSAMWVSVATVYVNLHAANIGLGFKQFDGVNVSGFTHDGLKSLNASHVIQKVDDDDIVLIGIINGQEFSEGGTVTVSRSVPEMDYVTECGNRVWGCKYGLVDGKVVNEIYASKLGDFSNWNCYQGISTDSFTASRGSDGAFTGAITHLGHPLFFKENCIEKVYPSSSGAHQIVTTEARGVEEGCWRSLEIVDEVLYYKSRDGICAYTGSLPQSVSDVFGDDVYSDARAGSVDGLYYVSMRDKDGVWHLMCLDTKRGAWYREDNTCAMMFAACDGNLFWIDEEDGTVKCREGEDEGAFSWYAESGVLGLDIPENQYMTNLLMRVDLAEGADIKVYVKYENGEWQQKIAYNKAGLRSFNIPVIPHRCDHLKLKVEGHGDCRIYAISKHITTGSEQMW